MPMLWETSHMARQFSKRLIYAQFSPWFAIASPQPAEMPRAALHPPMSFHEGLLPEQLELLRQEVDMEAMSLGLFLSSLYIPGLSIPQTQRHRECDNHGPLFICIHLEGTRVYLILSHSLADIQITGA
jgi:hypothetical protein